MGEFRERRKEKLVACSYLFLKSMALLSDLEHDFKVPVGFLRGFEIS